MSSAFLSYTPFRHSHSSTKKQIEIFALELAEIVPFSTTDVKRPLIDKDGSYFDVLLQIVEEVVSRILIHEEIYHISRELLKIVANYFQPTELGYIVNDEIITRVIVQHCNKTKFFISGIHAERSRVNNFDVKLGPHYMK